MAAASRIGSLVEIGIEQQRIGRLLSAGRAAVYAHPVDVHVGIFLGSGLNPRHVVGQSCILEILVAHVLKFARAERCAHSVDHHHDKSEFGDGCHVPVIGAERLGNILVAGTLIDVLDDGIFL